MRTRDIGMAGEKAACKFLKKNGYKILACNYQTAMGKVIGEIDIVAKQGEVISFIEVKTRQNEDFGLPCEFVTKSKQQRIIRTAYTYIAEHKLDATYRFDIIEVLHDGQKIKTLRHIPHAFTL